MDDKTFNDEKTALEWIHNVEGENARTRDNDIYPRLKTWVNLMSPLEVLEIGSGQGICSEKIDLGGRHYTGVEPSPFLVDRAKQLYSFENRRFLLGNAYDLPFSNKAFDAAFSVSVWHLLSDLQKAAGELSRVLKRDGRFLIITANPSAYSAWTDRYSEGKLDGRRFEGQVKLHDQSMSHDVLYLHTFDEMMNSLAAANLKVQEVETFRMAESSQEQKLYISIQGQKVLS